MNSMTILKYKISCLIRTLSISRLRLQQIRLYNKASGEELNKSCKTTQQLREMITDFLEYQFEKVLPDFQVLESKERLKIYCDGSKCPA